MMQVHVCAGGNIYKRGLLCPPEVPDIVDDAAGGDAVQLLELLELETDSCAQREGHSHVPRPWGRPLLVAMVLSGSQH